MTSIASNFGDLSQLALPQTAVKTGKKLEQEDFLRLMSTQLQNQDPLKPLDNNEFIAQMAQFSTVDGISEMNKSVGQLAGAFNGNQALQAAGMVGRHVLIENDNAVFDGSTALNGAVDLPYAAANAVVNIYSAAGELVGHVPLGARDAGLANFAWDGTRADGSPAAPGRYYLDATIGKTPLTTYTDSRVDSVALGGSSGALLSTDSGLTVGLAQIRAIR